MSYDEYEEPTAEPETLLPDCDIENAYALLAGCISRDGNLLFISGRQRSTYNDIVFVVNLQTLEVVERIQADDDLIFSIALSPNEHQLATTSRGKNLKIWDTASWEQLLQVDSTEAISSAVYDHRGWSLFYTGPHSMPYELLSFYSHINPAPLSDNSAETSDESLYILAANPLSGQLAAGGEHGKLEYWQTSESNQNNKILWKHKSSDGDILGLTFSNDGELLFSADLSGKVKVFNSATGQNLHNLEANSDELFWLTTDIRDNYLYAAGSSGIIYIWNLETFEPAGQFRSHSDQIQTILADPQNRFIISAGFSNRIVFHNPESFHTIAEMYLFDDALIAATPDGYYTGEGNYEQYVNSGTNNREIVLHCFQSN